MTISEAIRHALELLEKEGYYDGDIHDDLSLALNRLMNKHPKVAEEEL